jgi:putative heme iron utilization protein
MITLSLHNITEIELLRKKFGTFKVMQFTFVDNEGKKVYIDAFCENNEYPVINELPEMDVTV